MAAPATTQYVEHKMRLSADPLLAVAGLARAGLHDDYVVYENTGRWTFAGGALATVTLDRTGATLRQHDETFLPWNGAPLQQVQQLLNAIDLASWRAYGWATFELAYAKDGDVDGVGDDVLLHLIAPHTEVCIEHGWAIIRSADADGLAAATAALTGVHRVRRPQPVPVDVRHDGADDYHRAVKLAVEDINARRYQKVILSRVVAVQDDIDFIDTYVAGRQGNRPARSFLLRLGGFEATGFSPEIVVQVGDDRQVVSQPLAGTRMLTDDPVHNARLRSELLANAKEIYEHAISVKAACNDMLQVCTAGSLIVDEFMSVRERGSVQHLASRVTGTLARGRRSWDAFGAVFPAVTASGVPKQAAYAGIRQHENRPRGLYSGAVMTVDANGAMDASLVLRAVYRQDGDTWLQAGAGIVEQSRPEREFDETCEKLDSIARYLVPTTAPA